MDVKWIVAAAIVVVFLVYLVRAHNRLVRGRNQVENAWFQLDKELQRRYELIPNVNETVAAEGRQEIRVFETVAQARAAAIAARGPRQQAQAENMITSALGQLLAVAEAYPDLKSDEQFSRMLEELNTTEGRIAFARQFYNDTVLAYNTSLQTFPRSVVAGLLNFAPREYFEIDEAARGPVKVKFDF